MPCWGLQRGHCGSSPEWQDIHHDTAKHQRNPLETSVFFPQSFSSLNYWKHYYLAFKEQVITSWYLSCQCFSVHKFHVVYLEVKFKNGFPWEMISFWLWSWRLFWRSMNCKSFLRRYLSVPAAIYTYISSDSAILVRDSVLQNQNPRRDAQ